MMLAALASALVGHVETAAAGTYRVYSCTGPDGRPAPIGDGGYGWQPAQRQGTTNIAFTNDCGSGHGIAARLSGDQPYGAGGDWRFHPPPNTSIVAFDVIWSGTAAAGGESTLSRSDQPDPIYERRYSGNFGPERVVESGVDLTYLSAIVACSFQQPTCSPGNNPVASYRLAETTMTLRDNTTSTASNLSGDLVASPSWRGVLPVAFDARDSGAGVYRLIVNLDGQDALAETVDANGGRCADADLTNGDPHEFLYPAPCGTAVNAQLSVDTGNLPVGAHQVTLVLEDAAGNRAVMYGPVTKTILPSSANRGAANGTPASDQARFTGRRHRTITTSFRHRRLRVRAHLVGPDRTPIAGATIEVLAQLHRAGSRFRPIGAVRTSRKGGFSFKAPPGASRTLRFGYRSHVNDDRYAATLDVLQRVRASATLHASRHVVPAGGAVIFRGRLRGGYVPPRGKLIELQATDRGRWRTFALVRSSRRGGFRYRYRFAPGGPRTFAFRVRVRFERSYPYVLGYSKRTRVSVG
jgi:hypothetical protein